MAQFTNKLADITIPSGATKSRMVVAEKEYGDARKLFLQTPASIDGKTITIKVTYDQVPNITTGNWATLADSTGTAISPAAISKARNVDDLIGTTAFYLEANSAPSLDVTFGCAKQWLQ